jgi:hypothetical protein
MSPESPPGPGKGEGPDRPNPGPAKQKHAGRRLPFQIAPVKKLLAYQDPVWLFEVREGGRVSYVVERKDLWWRFGLLFPARAKFDRQVQKYSRKCEGTPMEKGAASGSHAH